VITNSDKKNFDIAQAISYKSKDPNTQVACMILGPDGEPRSWGYNGMPRGMDDENLERQARPEKYFWFEHAERNAIYNAARVGVSLKDCTIYCTMYPCMDCARGLVQVGIRRVVCPAPSSGAEPIWQAQVERVKQMFKELNIEVDYIYSEVD
jgi:dCMP deaminase